MTRRSAFRRCGLGAALAAASTAASAQIMGQFALVSAALPMSNDFVCTVVNASSQPVTLTSLQLVDNGMVLPNPLQTSCPGTLAAGARCSLITVVYPVRGQVVPYCRATYTASQSGALIGSLHGYYTLQGSSRKTVAALPLQPLTGVTLAIGIGAN